MKAQIILTPSESKKLIAKGVVAHPLVQTALKEGRIAIGAGTTNSFVLREMLGEDFNRLEGSLSCGVVVGERVCVTQGMIEHLTKYGHAAIWLLRKGQIVSGLSVQDIVQELQRGDVFIKGANAVDPYGKAAVFLGVPSGGTIGRAYGPIRAKGVHLIIPVGLEKTIPLSVYEAAKETGIENMDYAMGMAFGMLPIEGHVMTEPVAIKILTGAEAIPVGGGGVAGGEGSIVMIVKGDDDSVVKAIDVIEGVKGEEPIRVAIPDCETCYMRLKHKIRCPPTGRGYLKYP